LGGGKSEGKGGVRGDGARVKQWGESCIGLKLMPRKVWGK